MKPALSPSRFDRAALAVIIVMLAALGLVLLAGDHSGVSVVAVAPVGSAGSTHPVRITFSEPMDHDNVAGHFRLEPPLPGRFAWDGNTMVFLPLAGFAPGADYTALLTRGSRAENGREVATDYTFTFTARQPRLAYLSPADGGVQNIHIADPTRPEAAAQVTFSESGVLDFAVGPAGRQIAFTERSFESGTTNIWLLDLETGRARPLTDCRASLCQSPAWKPDGTTIAYERIDGADSARQQDSADDVARVWLIDLRESPPVTFPLFVNPEIQGRAPQWSADARRIAMFDTLQQGVFVYNFSEGDFGVIPTQFGTTGDFSPRGGQLVVPEVVFRGSSESRGFLRLAELATREFFSLDDDDALVDDSLAAWHPDGERIAIARRYLDNRWTAGRQLYLMQVESRAVEPLIVDAAYATGYFEWHPAGEQLVIQRIPLAAASGAFDPDPVPEIWTYTLDGGALTRITENAFHPRWLP